MRNVKEVVFTGLSQYLEHIYYVLRLVGSGYVDYAWGVKENCVTCICIKSYILLNLPLRQFHSLQLEPQVHPH